MKITAPLLALAFASAVTANDQSTCAINHPHVANAIGKFCQNQNMVIPSKYAKNGMRGDNAPYAQIWIKGNCKPAQWVPWDYCFNQFFNMCAHRGAVNTLQTRKYGRNNCQTWYTYAGQPKKSGGGIIV